VNEFVKKCSPLESRLYVFVDRKNGAHYLECHLMAHDLVKLCTTDVALDPEEQADYRANRDLVEDSSAFEQMKLDAKGSRSFSNIVAEFDLSHNPKLPIKIIGGQHRYTAVKQAYQEDIDVDHGLKIYFGLNKDQRLDLQLISNTNIDVSSDLYDRLQETASGPKLRQWSQEVGFLDKGKDFSARREKGSTLTVRSIRSFLVSYYLGKALDPQQFENSDTTPYLCRTGKPDSEWEKLRKTDDIWKDVGLRVAAKEFVLLDQSQREAIEKMHRADPRISLFRADKAVTYSVMTAWAYVAGFLQSNNVRLQRHYGLKTSTTNGDPLNAEAMSGARHKTDEENYRGLGTRSNSEERRRCVELFHLQAEKGKGITAALADAAIKRDFTKQAKLEQLKAEKKVYVVVKEKRTAPQEFSVNCS
jgi:hypothetical protein